MTKTDALITIAYTLLRVRGQWEVCMEDDIDQALADAANLIPHSESDRMVAKSVLMRRVGFFEQRI